MKIKNRFAVVGVVIGSLCLLAGPAALAASASTTSASTTSAPATSAPATSAPATSAATASALTVSAATAGPASDAPSCITYSDSHFTTTLVNNCGDVENVQVVIIAGPNSGCIQLQPNEVYNYSYPWGWFDHVQSC